MENCVFCEIIKGERTAEIIYEDEYVIAFYGLTDDKAHLGLVVPKKHIPNVLGITEEDSEFILRIHLAIQKVAEIHGVTDTGFRVITNIGVHGQQEVYHIHYHVIGGRQLKWEF